jgi:hypothetical protein
MNTENLKSKLEQIPNNVSGDGKSFVAQLKKYLQSFRDDTKNKIDSIGAGAVEQVFDLQLSEEHDYDSHGNPINNIFVEFDNTNVSNYLNAQIWMRKSTENAYRMVGTTSNVTYTIPDVLTGATYYVKVIACSTNSGTADFDDAPEEDITIQGSVLVPAAPTQFYLTFDEEGALWEWQFVDNGYVDFFELRMDGHAGTWDANRLDSTRNTYSRVNPPSRSGTAYLFIRNVYGMYSQPATHTFNIAAPSKPNDATLEMTLDGVVITMDPLPLGCIGYELEITDYQNNAEIYESKNNQFVYFQFSGSISVRYRFVDPAGHGEWSDAVSGNVKTILNAIELPAISYSMFDAATQAAVDQATTALTAVDELGDQLLDIITTQGEGTSTEFALLQSQVNTNTNSISTVIANLNVSPDGTNSAYTSINQLKQTANSISSTLATYQTTQNGINQTVSTNISNLQQTATGLSSTVQTLTSTTIPGLTAADTALSNRITTNASNITQASNSITAVVTELSKTDPSTVNYAAITALSSGIDLCVKDTDLTGATIVNRINISPTVTTIDGKYLHVTGQTVFDDAVVFSRAIASGAVTEAKLGTSAVTATKIKDGEILTAKLAANAVTAAKIQANAIETDKIKTGAVTAIKMTVAALDVTGNLKANTVGASQLQAESVIAGKIAANAVTASNISVANLSAISANMGTVTAGTVKGITIIGSNIKNTAGTFTVSPEGVITGAKLIASTIQNAANNPTFKVTANGAITGAALSASTISGGTITGSTIIGATLRNSSNTFSVDANGVIKGASLTAPAITGGTIQSNTSISSPVISGGTITGTTIIGSTIQNAASNPTFKVTSSGTVTGAKLIAPTIQNAASNPSFSVDANGNIKGATLTAATINTGTINANMITSAGFTVRASVIGNGTVSGNGGTIPLPSGYTEAQCLWAAYPPELPYQHPDSIFSRYRLTGSVFSVVGRKIIFYGIYSLPTGGERDYEDKYYYPNCTYRIIGIK